MFRALIIVFVVTFAIPVPGEAADFVKIGFWNIEHLGKRTPGQQPIAIAEYIDGSGIEVLGLCEIHVTDEAQNRLSNEVLDTAFAILNQEPACDWKYELFRKSGSGKTAQLCGIAWNAAHITKDGESFEIPVSDDVDDEFFLWDRHPFAAKFSAGNGRTDFVVIPVHMKSNVRPSDPNRAQGRSGAEFGAAQRELKALSLASKLPAVEAHFNGEKDILIIGDTNVLDRREKTVDVFLAAGFTDLNEQDASTFVRGNAPFDRIFVPNQPEFAFARQRILVDCSPQEHEEFLSDHNLIMTTFRVKADDDP